MTKYASIAVDEAMGYSLVLVALSLGVLMVLILAEASSASFGGCLCFFAATLLMWIRLLPLRYDLCMSSTACSSIAIATAEGLPLVAQCRTYLTMYNWVFRV